MVSVTFDSNVWESVVDDAKRIDSPWFVEIHDLILQKAIDPYFFEGILTLETIQKQDRKKHIAEFKPSISIQVGDEEPRISKGTPPPELSEYLKKTIPKAIGMGFKFIRTPRIGGHGIDPFAQYAAKDIRFSLSERLGRTIEVGRFIESLGAGKAKLDSDISKNLGNGLVEKTTNDTSLTDKQFAKNIAEWVDGDAIAAHYGYGIDYFCTNDKASGAGASSIFSGANLKSVCEKYGIKVVSPNELLGCIRPRT
ncbi:hypothetical protein QN360_01055 [Glaciimonas sp. CA11.2]|uniref:hypothetical protein n=1 Tax=Glaciimonas sp. CA11.2 TaxID=3048601 RepID=UPI002AB3C89B|nr:hypothetical protein [Glaciimonas sp. CA11.2]MDY7549175.1 hypothetical protein [Glaciimonas sp. CA11.2]MEB0161495.1 hypothetical protein [Glaciimonas sp. CA11.2]